MASVYATGVLDSESPHWQKIEEHILQINQLDQRLLWWHLGCPIRCHPGQHSDFATVLMSLRGQTVS